MKALLTFLALLPITATFAQKYEIGIGGGISVNSKPTDNMYYKGESTALNYAGEITFMDNMKNNWQLGADIHILELSRIANAPYADPYQPEKIIGTDGKRFIYSKVTTSITGVINRKLCVTASKSYLYLGAAVGLGIARDMNSSTLPSNASYVAPDGGYGICFGLQAGYNLSLSHTISLNAEFAPRYYDVDYTAHAAIVKPHTNLHYRILAYPVTVGVRVKFGYKKVLNATTGETEYKDMTAPDTTVPAATK